MAERRLERTRSAYDDLDDAAINRLVRLRRQARLLGMLKDEPTGIAIRFVKQYDVDKDKTPTSHGVDTLRAWTKAHKEERDIAESEGRPFNQERFIRNYRRYVCP